jgi:hypothetical protein
MKLGYWWQYWWYGSGYHKTLYLCYDLTIISKILYSEDIYCEDMDNHILCLQVIYL